MRIAGLAFALAAILALTPIHARAAASEGCAAMTMLMWAPGVGKTYRASAVAAGRNCANANVTLTIRGEAGATLLTFASAAADLPDLAEAEGPVGMAALLRRWIEQPAGGRTTRDLPAWEAGTEEPGAGPTGFRVEPEISRPLYADLRKWARPIFCFMQGIGREGCYALDPKADTLTLIGTRGLPD